MPEDLVRTILAIARQTAEHGKELAPHQIADLEAISCDDKLPWQLRTEAESLLMLEMSA